MAATSLHDCSSTNGLHSLPNGGPLSQKRMLYIGTLSGTTALNHTYPNLLKLDPGGAHRDVTLDPEETAAGLFRWIVNAADAAENLVLKDDAGNTIATVNQNECAVVFCDGAAWNLFYVATIALS